MKKSKVTGMIGTAVLHGLALLLLFSLTLVKPEPQEEGGVPVMLGETALAAGNADPYELTEVDVMPQPEPEIPQPEAEDALITQTDEPSVQVKREERKKDEPEEKKPEQPAEPEWQDPWKNLVNDIKNTVNYIGEKLQSWFGSWF